MLKSNSYYFRQSAANPRSWVEAVVAGGERVSWTRTCTRACTSTRRVADHAQQGPGLAISPEMIMIIITSQEQEDGYGSGLRRAKERTRQGRHGRGRRTDNMEELLLMMEGFGMGWDEMAHDRGQAGGDGERERSSSSLFVAWTGANGKGRRSDRGGMGTLVGNPWVQRRRHLLVLVKRLHLFILWRPLGNVVVLSVVP